eukprot:scaffold45212_cov28-Phaeocystis_antarctica.AAC.1
MVGRSPVGLARLGGRRSHPAEHRSQTAMGRELYLLWQVQNTKDELLKLPWPRDTVRFTQRAHFFSSLSRTSIKASIASKSAHAQKQQSTRTKRHRDELTKHVLVAPKTVSLNPRSRQPGPGTRTQPPVSARAGHMRARVPGTGSGPGWAE